MAEQLNNLWCVTGLSGSGKTTLAQNLAETGDFETVGRDDYLQHFISSIATPLNLAIFTENLSRAYECIDLLKDELASYVSWIEMLGVPDDLVQVYRNFLRLPNTKLLQIFRDDRRLVSVFSCFFAMNRASNSATMKAKEKPDKIILFDNPELSYASNRVMTKSHLLNNDIATQLLILRGTRSQIMDATLSPQRQALGSERCDPETVFDHDPYDPKENWERILVVPTPMNPGTVRTTVREKLLRGAGQNVVDPIDMCIDHL